MGKGNKPNSADALTDEEIEEFYRTGVLGNKTKINSLDDSFGRPKTMNYPASSSLHVEHSNFDANLK